MSIEGDLRYPYPEMQGHEAIRTGLQWALDGMKSMGFAQKQFFNSDDKLSGIVELDTHHVQSSGRVLDYLQIFVVETQDGLITRKQSNLPYGLNGIGGFFLRMSHKSHRRKHKAYAPSSRAGTPSTRPPCVHRVRARWCRTHCVPVAAWG